MKEKQEYIRYLWQQLINDKITSKELDELAEWLERNPDDEYSVSYLESQMADHEPANAEGSIPWNERLKMILQSGTTSTPEGKSAVQVDDSNKEPAKRYHNSTRIFKSEFVRFAAAAIVVICIGAYIWTKNTSTVVPGPKIEEVHLQRDIAPGGQKAHLTLSNGRKYELTGQNTTIVDEGTILTSSNGEIKYGKSGDVVYHTMATPRGGQYKLVLADGSAVWLNAASSITYPTLFAGATREVTVSGEAYFEIAKNKKHPFVIRSSNAEIIVLGTSFNFNNYFEDNQEVARTTLVEGSLKVSSHNNARVLVPGQQAEVSGKGISINDNVDIEKVLAWKNGEMILSESTTRKLMNEISRWYDVDIVYLGKIPNRKFYGSVNRNIPLSSLLKVLKAYGINTSLEGKKLIVQ